MMLTMMTMMVVILTVPLKMDGTVTVVHQLNQIPVTKSAVMDTTSNNSSVMMEIP